MMINVQSKEEQSSDTVQIIPNEYESAGKHVLLPNRHVSPLGCQPHKHIIYLKNIKTTSPTMQNIFYRFGYLNKLTLPTSIMNKTITLNSHFETSHLHPKSLNEKGKVDLCYVDLRLNVKELKKILYNNTVWITIMNEPSFLYKNMIDSLEVSNEKIDKFWTIERLRAKLASKYGYNLKLFDLGAKRDLNNTELQAKIFELDKLLDVVIIKERLSESLILMKEKLCWPIEDIVSLFSSEEQKLKRIAQLQQYQGIIGKLEQINNGDVELYNHFKKRHNKNVQEFGRLRMQQSVQELNTFDRLAHLSCYTNSTSQLPYQMSEDYCNLHLKYKPKYTIRDTFSYLFNVRNKN